MGLGLEVKLGFLQLFFALGTSQAADGSHVGNTVFVAVRPPEIL